MCGKTFVNCCMAVLLAAFPGAGRVRAAGNPGCVPDTLMRIVNNPAPVANEYFGIDVSISGDLAAVSAPFDSIDGQNKGGGAYVYDINTGQLHATLKNPAPELEDYLGVSTCISGKLVVVGASWDNPQGVNDAGSAYVYNADTGNLISTLNNPDPGDHDYFGYCVRISGGKVIVGSLYDNIGALDNAGRAFIFDAATGNLEHTLTSPAPTASAEFGATVAIEGNVAAVGSWLAPGGGAVYIFDVTTGALLRTIPQPNAGQSSFGFSVSISGDLLAAGQPRDGIGGSGAAYVFRISTGELVATLDNPAPAPSDEFGIAVSISGDLVVAGCWNQTHAGKAQVGGAYVFNANNGALLGELAVPSPVAHDRVGSSVWIDGVRVAVGGFHRATNNIADAGQAFLYTSAGGRATGDFDCSGCTDLNDFLFLLSNWWEVSSIGGAPLEIGDFFNFLDHWTTGKTCP